MTDGQFLINSIRAALEPHGLFLRGTVNFDDQEQRPLMSNGEAAVSVVLIGNAGGSIWQPFENWRSARHATDHPLDDWSKAVVAPLAERFGATAFFPSEPPFQPFQRWAIRAEGLKPSPLGILVHPRYGLWHGYRAALAFSLPTPQTGDAPAAHPCDSCLEKPCLSTCPAKAVSETAFEVARCRAHLAAGRGEGHCLDTGCHARNACPVGVTFRYPDAQLRFHMAALGTAPA